MQHSCRNSKVAEAFCDADCRPSTRYWASLHAHMPSSRSAGCAHDRGHRSHDVPRTFARKRLIHAMPRNKDRSINRAMVVGCGISATLNYLKLHMLKTLNPLLCNIHAETRKLWKPSPRQITALRPATRLPCMHTCTSSGSAVAPTIERIGHMQSP